MTDVIEIKQGNVDALRAMLEQMQQIDIQYRAAISALAIAHDVPTGWQWDPKGMRFVAAAAASNGNGNGNGDGGGDET